MFNYCKDKRSSYGTKNIENLEIIEVTKSKLEQFGYATTNAFTGGDVALNKHFFDFVEQNILNYFKYEQLVDILR